MSIFNNKLRVWVYGCSFSFGNWDDEYKNPIVAGESWPYLLDIGVDYEVENRAEMGGSWDIVKSRILEDIPYYSKQDILLIQVPHSLRFYNKFMAREFRSSGQVKKYAEKKCKQFLKLFGAPNYIFDDVLADVQIILKLLHSLDIKFLHWYTDGPITKRNLVNILKSDFFRYQILFKEHYTFIDWIGENPDFWYTKQDSHQSRLGHVEQAKLFSKNIKEKLLV